MDGWIASNSQVHGNSLAHKEPGWHSEGSQEQQLCSRRGWRTGVPCAGLAVKDVGGGIWAWHQSHKEDTLFV